MRMRMFLFKYNSKKLTFAIEGGLDIFLMTCIQVSLVTTGLLSLSFRSSKACSNLFCFHFTDARISV